MTAGQVSDYTGAAALLDDLSKAQWLLGDRGYDADWFREPYTGKGHQSMHSGAEISKQAHQNTTSAGTEAAAALRLCSAASRIGAV